MEKPDASAPTDHSADDFRVGVEKPPRDVVKMFAQKLPASRHPSFTRFATGRGETYCAGPRAPRPCPVRPEGCRLFMKVSAGRAGPGRGFPRGHAAGAGWGPKHEAPGLRAQTPGAVATGPPSALPIHPAPPPACAPGHARATPFPM